MKRVALVSLLSVAVLAAPAWAAGNWANGGYHGNAQQGSAAAGAQDNPTLSLPSGPESLSAATSTPSETISPSSPVLDQAAQPSWAAGSAAGETAGSNLTGSSSSSTAGDSSMASQETTSSAGTQTAAGLDRDHVLLVVPADQVKNLHQASPSAPDTWVLVPLDQFNRAVDMSGLQSSTSASQMAAAAPSTATTVTTEPGKEETAYSTPPASETHTLGNLGSSNEVQYIFPTAGGTVLSLRDGTDLFVPKAVNIPSTVEEGSWIDATYQQVDGQNVVTSLNVIPNTASERGNASAGGGS